MNDIAHEMKVRPARVFAGDVGPYVLLSPHERDEAVAEIERLRASEQAWKIIAKQNDQWNALPQSQKEDALDKALTAEVASGIEKDSEIERLRAALDFYARPIAYLGDNIRNEGQDDPFTPEHAAYVQSVGRDGGAVARSALGHGEAAPSPAKEGA